LSDERAFDDLVKRHGAAVRGLLYRLLQHWGDAEDLAQETFVRVYRKMGSFRGDASMRTWIFKIATNLALDAQRKRSRSPSHVSLDAGTFLASGTAPDRRLDLEERSEAAAKALEQLPFQQRAALIMKVTEGMKYEEIARVLDTTARSVKSSVHLARRKLMDILGEVIP
jgi:RNA polymerase sigma-70 factor (ECF subfamily)